MKFWQYGLIALAAVALGHPAQAQEGVDEPISRPIAVEHAVVEPLLLPVEFETADLNQLVFIVRSIQPKERRKTRRHYARTHRTQRRGISKSLRATSRRKSRKSRVTTPNVVRKNSVAPAPRASASESTRLTQKPAQRATVTQGSRTPTAGPLTSPGSRTSGTIERFVSETATPTVRDVTIPRPVRSSPPSASKSTFNVIGPQSAPSSKRDDVLGPQTSPGSRLDGPIEMAAIPYPPEQLPSSVEGPKQPPQSRVDNSAPKTAPRSAYEQERDLYINVGLFTTLGAIVLFGGITLLERIGRRRGRIP